MFRRWRTGALRALADHRCAAWCRRRPPATGCGGDPLRVTQRGPALTGGGRVGQPAGGAFWVHQRRGVIDQHPDQRGVHLGRQEPGAPGADQPCGVLRTTTGQGAHHYCDRPTGDRDLPGTARRRVRWHGRQGGEGSLTQRFPNGRARAADPIPVGAGLGDLDDHLVAQRGHTHRGELTEHPPRFGRPGQMRSPVTRSRSTRDHSAIAVTVSMPGWWASSLRRPPKTLSTHMIRSPTLAPHCNRCYNKSIPSATHAEGAEFTSKERTLEVVRDAHAYRSVP